MINFLFSGLVFLIGLLGFIKVEFVGALAINETCLLVVALFCVGAFSQLVRYPAVRSVLLLGLAYLLSQVASDLYRGTPSQDYFRGWAKITVMLVAFLFFVLSFFRFQKFILPYLLGYMLSPLATLAIYGATVGDENVYKFHVGSPLSISAFLAMGYAPRLLAKPAGVLPLLAGAFAFFQNARSLAGVTILGYFAAIFAARRSVGTEAPAKTTRGKQLLMLTALGVGAIGIVFAYRSAVSRGWFGEVALDKYEMQRQFGDSGKFSILSGRSEIYFALPQILESPIIGQGSWAKDWAYVYARARELGLNPEAMASGYGSLADVGLIPSHSHILGAWLEAGFLGGLFWVIVFFRVLKLVGKGSAGLCGPLGPVITYLLVAFLWDLLFSPFGGERRIFDGFLLAWLAWIETVEAQRGASMLAGWQSAAFKIDPIRLRHQQLMSRRSN